MISDFFRVSETNDSVLKFFMKDELNKISAFQDSVCVVSLFISVAFEISGLTVRHHLIN